MPFFTRSDEACIQADNFGTSPSATLGASVTPGTSNAEGSYTQIASAIGSPGATAFLIRVSDASATAPKNHLLDIGVDPAGGTSYTAVISNIVCGSSPAATATGSGQRFYFPLWVPGGATMAARVQGSSATPGTVRVGCRTYQNLASHWHLPCGQYSETIGSITNSNGVSFTPGNATNGTWVSLGTTTRDLWWWQLCYQIDNATITAEYTYVELGAGTTGNQRVLQRRFHGGTTGETCGDIVDANLLWHESYHPIVAGTEMWVRGHCNNAPDTGYNAVAIGIGG